MWYICFLRALSETIMPLYRCFVFFLFLFSIYFFRRLLDIYQKCYTFEKCSRLSAHDPWRGNFLWLNWRRLWVAIRTINILSKLFAFMLVLAETFLKISISAPFSVLLASNYYYNAVQVSPIPLSDITIDLLCSRCLWFFQSSKLCRKFLFFSNDVFFLPIFENFH